MRLGADLRDGAAAYGERWHATHQAGGAGFEENPLDWRSWKALPYLVFEAWTSSVTTTIPRVTSPANSLDRSTACWQASLSVGRRCVR